jgi:hypothetical protein
MKISSLFDLITDANDVLDFFERVESPEQLVSRLERLKRQGATEMFACLEGLRGSVTSALNDTLEMNASLDEPETDEIGDLNLDAELEDLSVENVNPASSVAAEDAKKDVPPST